MAIGWRHIFNGRWSVQWAAIQKAFDGEQAHTGETSKGNAWNVAMIQYIWSAWADLWAQRNTTVHGDTPATRRAAEAAAIRKRLRLVYNLRGRVEAAMEHRLATPMEELLQNGTSFLKNWLAMYEKRLYQSAERAQGQVLRGILLRSH